jgi:hypothetical protein
MKFRSIRAVVTALAASVLVACGGSSSDSAPAPAPAVTQLNQPVTLNLYPNSTSTVPSRLGVFVTAVGSAAVNMPLIFDTGSAGVTLYAPDIFPASMVTSAGFVFPAGQTSMTYNGITVTNQQGTRLYGSNVEHTQTGNLGFAQLTFGDAKGEITTGTMPVFLYYSAQEVATGAAIAMQANNQGIFGVAPTSGSISIAGSVAPAGGYPACAPDTVGTCSVASALKYVQYGSGVDGGFMLSPAQIQTCDITTAGSCTPEPMLTVGLTPALESGFSTMSLVCPPSGYTGPADIAGYPLCQKTTDDTTFTVSDGAVGSTTGGAVFDTGTDGMQIAPQPGSTLPGVVPLGATIMISTTSGFTYSYVSGSGPLSTSVITDTNDISIVGIGYFTTNSYFVDFTASIVGWK